MSTDSERMRSFVRAAREHGERLNGMWFRLVESPDDALSRELAIDLHREISVLGVEAQRAGSSDIQRVCQRLEDLLFLAHRRGYDVTEEFLLTVSIAVEFLGLLIQRTATGIGELDVEGFLVQLETLYQETHCLPPPERARVKRSKNAPPSSRRDARRSNVDPLEAAPAVDHVVRETRERLASAAAAVYLESWRVEGASCLRLREAWASLKAELAGFARVSVRTRLVPLEREIALLAREHDKVIEGVVEVDDFAVTPEVASVLEAAARTLVFDAIANGIEGREERARTRKPAKSTIRLVAQMREGAAMVSVVDDGAGLTPPAEESAAARVRAAVKKEGGSIHAFPSLGTGTTVTVGIPDAGGHTQVRAFRAPAAEILLAVGADWAVESGDVPSNHVPPVDVDPVASLGLPARGGYDGPRRRVILTRGDLSVRMWARSLPSVSNAERVCPTGDDARFEIVSIGGSDAVLVRPELLVAGATPHTVAPKAP